MLIDGCCQLVGGAGVDLEVSVQAFRKPRDPAGWADHSHCGKARELIYSVPDTWSRHAEAGGVFLAVRLRHPEHGPAHAPRPSRGTPRGTTLVIISHTSLSEGVDAGSPIGSEGGGEHNDFGRQDRGLGRAEAR